MNSAPAATRSGLTSIAYVSSLWSRPRPISVLAAWRSCMVGPSADAAPPTPRRVPAGDPLGNAGRGWEYSIAPGERQQAGAMRAIYGLVLLRHRGSPWELHHQHACPALFRCRFLYKVKKRVPT